MERKFLAHENCLHMKYDAFTVKCNVISFPFILRIVKSVWIH